MINKKNCPDCGVAVGEPHQDECDIERCSACGGQRISCDCETHDPLASVWTGDCPQSQEGDDEEFGGTCCEGGLAKSGETNDRIIALVLKR